MELTNAELAIALYITVSLVQQLMAAFSGDNEYLVRGGALVAAVAAAVGGGEGAVLVFVWWVACHVVNAVLSAFRGGPEL